ncbi:RelA/SpoT family protein [Phaeacidiphilus oryzae]|uniref:RelA/SpoT family protein n=1 Tax=Phaeacidiphilus oryzae TaxID=348818 RepID=UPI0009FC823C|nr:HD domain-containing protein [Phaeacidiphilus oryzae]
MTSEAGAVPGVPVPGPGAPGAPGAPGVPAAPAQRGRGARRGFAALLSTARPELPDAMEPVVRAHRARHPRMGRPELALLARAYQVAEASHRGQKRKSGEPYITHPLAVTMILAQLGAETTTLVAALLHDTVEDTDMTLRQVEEEFGPEVAYLVDGVTKLDKVDFGAAAEAETFRKMLVATGNDVRVMVIKLADRLHNMRTLKHMKPASQVRIAKVTRDVLIPLAERLGIQVVKTELEDLVFSVLHPQEHAATRALIAEHEAAVLGEDAPLRRFAARLRRQLREAGVRGEVGVRPRHCVSVHRTRLARGADAPPGPPAPGDLARVLVVVEEPADCYAVLGELHTCWTPLPGEFKDFVAAPKFNLYQSLHTAVLMAEGGGAAEVLVRTERMHQVAEFGVVALGGVPASAEPAEPEEGADPARPGWLERLLDWQRVTPDPDTFWSRLTADLSDDHELTVVTEDGRTLQLPAGADCVDAAYALGEAIGHRCVGARVNGRLVALSTQLSDGDVFDVLTEPPDSEPSGPSPLWLGHARTPQARIAIERWLTTHPCGPAPSASASAPPPAPAPASAGSGAGSDDGDAEAVAEDGADADTDAGGETDAESTSPVALDGLGITVAGRPGALPRLARCCTPVPPDPLVGFAIRGGAIAVHRADCPTAAGMVGKGRTPLEAGWTTAAGPAEPARPYRATVQVEALGRPRLLAELTAAISAAGVDITAAMVQPPRELRVRHTYTVVLPDAEALPPLMRAMLRVPGVYDVYRANRETAGDTGNAENPDDPENAAVGPLWGIRGMAAALFVADDAGETSRDPSEPGPPSN